MKRLLSEVMGCSKSEFRNPLFTKQNFQKECGRLRLLESSADICTAVIVGPKEERLLFLPSLSCIGRDPDFAVGTSELAV